MTTPPAATEHLDVIIVGAGISGIGAARYLTTELPAKSFAVLESRAATGGTWDLFRYPGTRSDSDLHTLGYEFKPWRERKSFAPADQILQYLRETATEYGIDSKVRLQHRVLAASWSTEQARWTVSIERTDTGVTEQLTCQWLFCAGGYYRYDQGFTPQLTGLDRFDGAVVHPQFWPEDLDYTDKRVVVIGSGATAVTLVPALAKKAALVTMLQRTPSYVMPVASEDPIANWLPKIVSAQRAFAITRRKNILQQAAVWTFCKRFPKTARRLIRRVNAGALPAGYPVDTHFNPPYDPWDQRLCADPGGDFFEAISDGSAAVVTDRISSITEDGIQLASGQQLEADILVTATGLDLLLLGGIELTVDGRAVDLPDTVAYKGMMLSGVPNFAFAIGYTNSSWTLKVGLLCEHFCRLLAHMDHLGYAACVPTIRDTNMPLRPLLDFGAGYVKRSLDRLPRQGPASPWLMSMNYRDDLKLLRGGSVEDPSLVFLPPGRPTDRRPLSGTGLVA